MEGGAVDPDWTVRGDWDCEWVPPPPPPPTLRYWLLMEGIKLSVAESSICEFGGDRAYNKSISLSVWCWCGSSEKEDALVVVEILTTTRISSPVSCLLLLSFTFLSSSSRLLLLWVIWEELCELILSPPRVVVVTTVEVKVVLVMLDFPSGSPRISRVERLGSLALVLWFGVHNPPVETAELIRFRRID